MHLCIGFKIEEGWKRSYHICEATAEWFDSGKANESGFALGHDGPAM